MTLKKGEKQEEKAPENNRLLNSINKTVSRRQFLKTAAIGGMGAASVYLLSCTQQITQATTPAPSTPTSGKREVYVPNAVGMVIGDPTRCVGCRRCEIACTTFNEGKTQPSLARVKVNRNYLFGPRGAQPGFWNAEGLYGNHRFIQDTCKQCPHPVPCLNACPYGAIEVVPPTNARVVNLDKCKGCKTCQKACPWGMPTFDLTTNKASKCHLCGGDPECVKACPTGALQYVPWVDKSNDPPRVQVAVAMADSVKNTCVECH